MVATRGNEVRLHRLRVSDDECVRTEEECGVNVYAALVKDLGLRRNEEADARVGANFAVKHVQRLSVLRSFKEAVP